MLIRYARYEPTVDEMLKSDTISERQKKQLAKKKDVVLYNDKECSDLNGRWLWYYKSKPNRNTKSTILCGIICKIVWLPNKEA